MATETNPPLPAGLAVGEIRALCRKHRVRELYVFGSALREDFRPDSDIDLLVVFEPDAERPWMGHFGDLEAELTGLLNRPVDLVSRRAVEQSRNWVRRKAILDQARLLYAA
jgi:hypothetical protein